MPELKRIPEDAMCRVCGKKAIESGTTNQISLRPDTIYIYRNAKMAKGDARHIFIHRTCYEKENADIKRRIPTCQSSL